ncbi:FkbM family methyltransferase [Mucilaginibacter sp. HD30]
MVFELNKVVWADLIKINIEGGEYDILLRMIESGLISKIKRLQIQFHELEKDSFNKMNKIREGLLLTHRPINQYEFVWEDWILI